VKFTNVRELKSKTSEMLRTVERGNTVLVTTHGRPTAMLVPVTEDDIEDALLAYSPKLRKKIEDVYGIFVQAEPWRCPITVRLGSRRRLVRRDRPRIPFVPRSTRSRSILR
jgi:prevent-host-death family protein